jgi:tRNA(Ile)-lysidine synthase
MNSFLRNFITGWRRLDLPEQGCVYLAAVSGGADSVSLLLALHELSASKKLGHRFVIAHFNHGLRGHESEQDEEFVRDLTVKYGFELAVGHGRIEREGNLEQNARTARYEFLRETAANLHAAGVLTGHTMNDQAETFLINLIRGSGPGGLGGMKTIRSLKSQGGSSRSKVQGSKLKEEVNAGSENQDAMLEVQETLFDEDGQILLIRPLLNWAKRSDTENFCHEMGVEYCYDTMNEDLAFRRVRIRKVLIPMLEDFNPKIIETLAKTASLMRQDGGTSDPFPAEQPDKLALKDVKNQEKADLYRTLRAWLEHHRGNLRGLELKHIEAVENLINSRKSGKTVELPGGDMIVKENGMLNFVAKG